MRDHLGDKLIRWSSIAILVICIITSGSVFYLSALHRQMDRPAHLGIIRDFLGERVDLTELALTMTAAPKTDSAGIYPAAGHKLNFRLPEGVSGAKVSIGTDDLGQRISISIPGVKDAYFAGSPLSGDAAGIENISYQVKDGRGEVYLKTEYIYQVTSSWDDNYLYLDFTDLHDIYDQIVVIDAGHGGRMPGTVNGGVREKDINLGIALKLKEMFEADSANTLVLYTRTQDSNPDYDERVTLANAARADAFVSIHSNSMAGAGRNSTSGVETLFQVSNDESKTLAKLLTDKVCDETGAVNRGVIEGDDIYIVRSSKTPVALVEVGFMSNQAELRNLASDEYQEKVALGLYKGIKAYLEEDK